MAFTNAQVMAAIRSLDARIAGIEAVLVAGTPAQASASTSTRTAAEAVEKPVRERATCPVHEKTFNVTPAGSPTGTAFHATWCKAGFTPAA